MLFIAIDCHANFEKSARNDRTLSLNDGDTNDGILRFFLRKTKRKN
ncbi:hypothetical protein [Helicobacter sp. T3_23-1056]